MAGKTNAPKTQVSIEEYAKVRESRAKKRLQLTFPTVVKCILAVPAAYILFLLIYFLLHLRLLPEH